MKKAGFLPFNNFVCRPAPKEMPNNVSAEEDTWRRAESYKAGHADRAGLAILGKLCERHCQTTAVVVRPNGVHPIPPDTQLKTR